MDYIASNVPFITRITVVLEIFCAIHNDHSTNLKWCSGSLKLDVWLHGSEGNFQSKWPRPTHVLIKIRCPWMSHSMRQNWARLRSVEWNNGVLLDVKFESWTLWKYTGSKPIYGSRNIRTRRQTWLHSHMFMRLWSVARELIEAVSAEFWWHHALALSHV